ncbi:hypothetical protein FRC06_000226, partial [Ceratobasidium sp. 370]
MSEPEFFHHLSSPSPAYSPDGADIASGSADGTVRIWDAHTGQPHSAAHPPSRSVIRSTIARYVTRISKKPGPAINNSIVLS